jgi:2-hydroxychromene-2-carboxylate isomerase
MDAPYFFYDFNSPYAYLAASRVDDVLPVRPRWVPVAFAFVLSARERTPWSMIEPTRRTGMRECEQRARRYGLPPLCWPPGWPVASYSLAPLRAAYVAAAHDLLREFSAAAFARNFVEGMGLSKTADIVALANTVGLDSDDMLHSIGAPGVKQQLRAATDDALARGIVGVPTVAADERLFWGDDRLEDAAAACA